MDFFEKIASLFTNEKYMQIIWKGFTTTIYISLGAMVLGLVLGTLVALVGLSKKSKIMVIPKAICKVYVTVIRGTPMALQLFIMA